MGINFLFKDSNRFIKYQSYVKYKFKHTEFRVLLSGGKISEFRRTLDELQIKNIDQIKLKGDYLSKKYLKSIHKKTLPK